MIYKWRRIGAFMINTSIIGMFFQLFSSITLNYISYSMQNIVYDFFVVVFYFCMYVFIAVGFETICFRLLKNSFGHSILSLKVCNIDGTILSQSVFIRREFFKYYMLFATLGLYGVYSFYCIVTKKQLFHDKKFETFC